MRLLFVTSLMFMLFTAALAFAAMPATLTVQWSPAAGNTLTADTFVISRQVGGGSWTEVCRATPAMLTCSDSDVPMGQSVCWKAQAMAGTMAGPESPPVCRTMQQFTGTISITVPMDMTGTVSFTAPNKAWLKAPKHK